MTEFMLILLAIPLFLLLGFTGCVGDDPETIAKLEKEKAEVEKKLVEEQKKAEVEAQLEAAAKEDRKYTSIVSKQANLVSYWRLSEGEDGNTVAEDSAPDQPQNGEFKGQGVNKNVGGALTLIADPADKAVHFPGQGAYVEVPFHLLLNPPQSFSIELWVRPDADAGTGTVLSSCQVDNDQIVRGYAIDVVMLPNPTLRVRLGFVTGEVQLEAGLGDGLEHDGWRHIAVTYDIVEKRLRLYVNADNSVPDAELGGPGQTPVFYAKNETAPLRIGAANTATGGPDRFFKGGIDEVALYSQALEGSEVRKHFLAATSVPA